MSSVWNEPGRTFAFHKGRVAIYAILRASGIGPGDEVLVPGFTCVVVPAAILYTGASVGYYDLKPNCFEPDFDDLRARITDRTRAVLVQHTFGYPALGPEDIDELRGRGLLVIEDCAHAIGSTVDGKQCGTLGDAAFMSFQWSKPLPAALGGMARVTRDDLAEAVARVHHDTPVTDRATEWTLSGLQLAHRTFYRPRLAHIARNTYRTLGSFGLVPGSSSTDELERPVQPAGYLSRPGAGREQQLRALLEQSDRVGRDRRRRAAAWIERLEAIDRAPLSPWSETSKVGARSEVVPLRLTLTSPRRDALLVEAERAGVELGDWFMSPLHPLLDSMDDFGYRAGTSPRAEELCRTMFNLMTHDRVGERDMDRTIRFLETADVTDAQQGAAS